jgi:hypothetical protein
VQAKLNLSCLENKAGFLKFVEKITLLINFYTNI